MQLDQDNNNTNENSKTHIKSKTIGNWLLAVATDWIICERNSLMYSRDT
jgi:hypothetical protein